MFYYLKGTVAHKSDNFVVIDIGGVGYKVFTSLSTINKAAIDATVTVYTYTYVREDALDIFGFLTLEELQFFQSLINISGVGPKVALAILSTHTPQDMMLSVVTNDAKNIARAPGVGTKLAQRIILELKDKMKDKDISDAITGGDALISETSEAVSALVVLGYPSTEARRAVNAVGEGKSLEDTIKEALQFLMR